MTNQQDTSTERERFEAWASDDGKWPQAVERRNGGYKLMKTECDWIAWQAALASRDEAAQQPQWQAVSDEQIDAVLPHETGFDGWGTHAMNTSDLRRICRAILALRDKPTIKDSLTVERVPLSGEQIKSIAKPFVRTIGGDHWYSGDDGIKDDGDIEHFAHAIEAAHGITAKEQGNGN